MRLLLLHLALCLGSFPALAQEPPPLPPSPVEQFRDWLTMAPPERDKILALWPVEKQAVLKRKLDHYSKLPEEERERRLTMLELRHFLRPLMSTPPDQRPEQIKLVPVRLRELVLQRLERWDKLNPALQAQVLEHEAVLGYFSRVPPAPLPSAAVPRINPAPTASSQADLSGWTRLSEAERQKLSAHLAEFFELPRSHQAKTLESLSGLEREEIEKTLSAFSKLPPQQKRACIESFGKFAHMAPGERDQFLRNAARWQAMSRDDRQTWKRLVQSLPPMPPDPRDFPPLPSLRPGPAPTNR